MSITPPPGCTPPPAPSSPSSASAMGPARPHDRYQGVRARPVERPPDVERRSPASCPHLEFMVRGHVNRLADGDGPDGEVIAYDLEIAVDCVACLTPFEFMGLPLGLSPAHPTSSVDGMTMTAPIRPYGSPADFGLNRVGYSIRMAGDGDDADGTQGGTDGDR